MEINLCRSKAGHDKGRIYFIKEKLGDVLLLVDGDLKTIDNPKRKNIKHVQPIKRLPVQIDTSISIKSDLDVRKLIKEYKLLIKEEI